MISLSQRVRRAFFARHGGRLRAIQELAFSEFELGRDGLVSAPTGGGKTEAVLAPVAQRLLDEGPGAAGQLRALIVSPTRALATDLHKRMSPIFRQLGLRLDVATSDKRTVTSVPTDVLIRTPEGLDIDVVKRGHTLANVRDVVIDEVHLFLESARGTQLSGLLARLGELSPAHRRLGLSATLPDKSFPSQARLLRDPIIVEPEASDESSIDVIFHDWTGSEEHAASAFVASLRQLGVKKAIGFVSRKSRAETLTRLLDRGYFRGKSFTHHGDLASSGRRKTEERLKTTPVALVLATTTLEVGVDIGTIDTCILFDVPPSHASFMQRVGRSGRRSGKRRAVCVAGLYDSRVSFAQVIAKPSSRSAGTFKPFLAGCIQQIFSYVIQGQGCSRELLGSFVATAFGMSEPALEALLAVLVREEWLVVHGSSVNPGSRLVSLAERVALHVTFAMSYGQPLVDETSGQRIGRVPVRQGDAVVLGGKGRHVRHIDPVSGIAYVRTVDGGVAQFGTQGESVFESLARACLPLTGGRYR